MNPCHFRIFVYRIVYCETTDLSLTVGLYAQVTYTQYMKFAQCTRSGLQAIQETTVVFNPNLPIDTTWRTSTQACDATAAVETWRHSRRLKSITILIKETRFFIPEQLLQFNKSSTNDLSLYSRVSTKPQCRNAVWFQDAKCIFMMQK